MINHVTLGNHKTYCDVLNKCMFMYLFIMCNANNCISKCNKHYKIEINLFQTNQLLLKNYQLSIDTVN